MIPKINFSNIKDLLKQGADIITRLFRYNLKIIFANKFIYFLLTAIIFFLLVTILSLVNSDANPNQGSIYYLLMFPGILLIFYPTVFGIQNDVDARMLEILFAIPNYRYKVWLIRMIIIYLVVFSILVILSLLSAISLVEFSIFKMVYELMFPIFFLGSLAFMVSTLIRNGFGTVVAMVIIGMGFWILSGNNAFRDSKWNIFLNPFNIPSEMNDVVWANIVFNNRVYLLAGIVLSILFGLLNLQKREKFI
jgi:hypothetical protein